MAANPDFMRFLDRRDAGRHLAARLAGEPLTDPVVIGMARGGVPVAAEVARELGAPLDIAVVRKVGAPDQPELAIGAIAEGDAAAIDTRDAELLGFSEETVAAIVARERRELERRERAYRAECPRLPLAGRTAILVDDGLATGHTAMAAARSLHNRGAAKIVLAVPVCPIESTLRQPEPPVDQLVCLTAPRHMLAVGYWYADFPQVSDDEVISLLREARAGPAAPVGGGESEIEIDAGGGVRLSGSLSVPAGAWGVVLFVHGSGSSRHSPRNRMVADRLGEAGLATLLFDLLDPQEARDRSNVFDIPLLAARLLAATRALREIPGVSELPAGFFGASTGAAAALVAAAEPQTAVGAVVSRGGRPDLAAGSLPLVSAPTLLIVGSADSEVIELNKDAMSRMTCHTKLSIVPGAGHLFEAPGELEQVADLAAGWFKAHLAAATDHATA